MVATTNAAMAHPNHLLFLFLRSSDGLTISGISEMTVHRKQSFDFLFTVQPIVHEFKDTQLPRDPIARADAKPDSTKFETVGKIWFQRQTRRIKHAESFPLLHLFHARGHLRLVLLFQQFVVVGLGLIVTAGQICQLLLAHRFVVQTILIVVDFRFQVRQSLVRDSRSRLRLACN